MDGLNIEQKAKLAYALAIIRESQSLRRWTQRRFGDEVRLLRRDGRGRLQEVYIVCRGERQHS
jgi:hypothetical protein